MITAGVYSRFRLQLQVWCLIPINRNTSADLHERNFFAVVFDNLLGFDEIRDVSVVVDATAKESSASTLRGPSRDEDPREVVAVDGHLVDGDDWKRKEIRLELELGGFLTYIPSTAEDNNDAVPASGKASVDSRSKQTLSQLFQASSCQEDLVTSSAAAGVYA